MTVHPTSDASVVTMPHTATRLTQLDGLRGLAAFSVVLMHYTSSYDRLIGHPQPVYSWPLGGLGVHLFFMLSGFVIFLTVDRARSLADFCVSRFARLYPAYWTAALITLLFTYNDRLPGHDLSFPMIMANITMIQGFLGFGDIDPVYWTLQAELQFYACMGIMLLLRQLRSADLWFAILVVADVLDHFVGFTDWPGLGTLEV